MLYTLRNTDKKDPDVCLRESLEPVIRGLGLTLIELSVFRQKGRGRAAIRAAAGTKAPTANPGSVQVKVTVYKDGVVGVEDCTTVHRAIFPRLELTFPGQDIYLEVSSPGIDRLIKDGSEFAHYLGREVRCYRTDISDWTAGILSAADEEKIVLRGEGGETTLPYEIIAKARLNAAP